MKTNLQTYNSYKPSGVEWLGEIPEHWEVKKVTHIFNKIGSGTTPTAGTPKYYDNGQINWLQTGDLNDGFIENTNKKITSKALNDFSTLKYYPKESIVIAMYGATIGKLGYLNIETTTNQACCVLGNPNDFLSKFGFYSFMNAKTSIISMSYGGGQPNISQDLVKSLRLVVPPFSEQTAIANFLDDKTAKIDQAITINKNQIELLKECRQILIHKAVTRGLNDNVKLTDSGVEWIGEIPEGWEVKRLKYVANLVSDKMLSKANQLDYIGMENIESWTGNFISTNSETEGLANYFNQGDILFGKLRPYLAKVFLAKEEGICSSEFLVYRNGNEIYNWYLHLLMLSFEFIKLIDSSTYGSKMPRANSDFIGNQLIPIPPKEEQTEIIEYIETATTKIATAISLKEKEIEKLKEYKASLINSAVTGKIKVN